MNQEIQSLQDALQFKQGIIMFISAVMALSRILAKPVNEFVQSFLSKLISNYPAGAATLVSNPFYRVGAFALDLIFSVKCPTPETVLAQIKETGNYKAETAFVQKTIEKTKPNSGHFILELIITIGVIALTVWLLSVCVGCHSEKYSPGPSVCHNPQIQKVEPDEPDEFIPNWSTSTIDEFKPSYSK